jgi:hypothetical protein
MGGGTGGGVTGGGTGGGTTGGGGGTSSNTAAQITAVRTAADTMPGAVSLPIQGALVTFVKPLVPDAGPSTDPAGFIVQAGATGPALFVSIDASTLSISVGDIVDFTVTSVGKNAGLRVASGITGFARQSSGNPVSNLAQTASNVDFSQAVAIDDRECELLTLNGTLTSDMVSAGSGFQSASLATAGTTDPTLLKLRVTNAVADAEGLGTGCTVNLTASPLWRFNNQAQPSAFSSSALSGSTCPTPVLSSAVATSLTSVRATFNRPMNPAAINTGSMTIAGLTVSQVVQAGPTSWNLTTSTQTGGAPYTLTVSGSVTDLRGTVISSTGRTANFNGFVPPSSGLVISEVDYDNVAANPDGGAALSDSTEFIEIYNPSATVTESLANRSLVLVNGGTGATQFTAYTTVDLSGAGSLAPGQFLVAASATTLAGLPSSVKKVTIPGTIDLIQNGGTDAVALVDSLSSTVLDSLSYEGSCSWNSPAGTVVLQEGSMSTTALADSNTINTSICRIPTGQDTNVNGADFKVCSTPTPGATNIQ